MDFYKSRLSFQTPKEMQVRECNTRTGLCPWLPEGQEGGCITEYFVLPHHCSPDRLSYWCT